MRDLVETVIGQVLKQEPTLSKKNTGTDHGAEGGSVFKSEFVRHLKSHEQPVFVQGQEIKNKELWAASLKFEGMMFRQMMDAMRKTVPESGFLPHGFAQGVQQSMFDQAVADAGSQRGSLGLAMNIYRQLEETSSTKVGNQSVEQTAVQAARKASDSESMATFTDLRGGIGGAH